MMMAALSADPTMYRRTSIEKYLDRSFAEKALQLFSVLKDGRPSRQVDAISGLCNTKGPGISLARDQLSQQSRTYSKYIQVVRANKEMYRKCLDGELAPGGHEALRQAKM